MYKAVVMGASAGGLKALKTILGALPADFPLPVAIVQHIAANPDSQLAEYFGAACPLAVNEACDKDFMKPGNVYFAPPGYHLLIEEDASLSLSVDGRVNFSCPSIDVLFESAADALGKQLIGVLLTGTSADGSAGLKAIKDAGGTIVVQNPETAEASYMPLSAIQAVSADYVTNLEDIAPLIVRLVTPEGGTHAGING